jgi:hypothetical protein
LRVRQSACNGHGGCIEPAVAFADCAQGHVYRLLDEMAFVAGPGIRRAVEQQNAQLSKSSEKAVRFSNSLDDA